MAAQSGGPAAQHWNTSFGIRIVLARTWDCLYSPVQTLFVLQSLPGTVAVVSVDRSSMRATGSDMEPLAGQCHVRS